MTVIQTIVNNSIVNTIGLTQTGVLSVILSLIRRSADEQIELTLSGLETTDNNVPKRHIKWPSTSIGHGDTIQIRIIEAEKWDSPIVSLPRDEASDLQQKLEYFRHLKNELSERGLI